MNTDNDAEIEDVILSNLRKLKEEVEQSEQLEINQKDNPDYLINNLPKIEKNNLVKDEEFDYYSDKKFFDEIYFKDSRLIKM
jgi:hypothetical protein